MGLPISQNLTNQASKAKIIAFLTVVTIAVGGCVAPDSRQNSNNSDNTGISKTSAVSDRQGKKLILTTLAGDRAIVESIVKVGAEVHGYEPTPSDFRRGQGADLILDNGLNLERWAERFYGNFPKVARVTMTTGIQPINIAGEAYQGKPNPHAWMSPRNALIYVENIRKALGAIDPANASVYDANARAYSQQIQDIDQKLKQAIAAIPPEKRYIVSCEGAFSYLAQDYGLKEVYIWEVNAERQATPKQVQKVIDMVRANKIPTVFCESTVSNEAQMQVVRETGAKFGGVFYVDSLSLPDGVTPTYLKLLEYNVNNLVKGLSDSS